MTLYVLPIVEGQTEQGCVEQLLHRVWTELLCRSERLHVVETFRGSRNSLVHPNGEALTNSVRKGFLNLHSRAKRDPDARSLLLILLDAENDCPADLGPRLLKTATLARGDAAIACVLAKRMLENWIVAGAGTLAGVNGLPQPLQPPANPEDLRGDAWLDDQLRSRNISRKYKKTTDARDFIARMDLQQCRATSPSFDKLCRDLTTLQPPSPTDPRPAPPPKSKESKKGTPKKRKKGGS